MAYLGSNGGSNGHEPEFCVADECDDAKSDVGGILLYCIPWAPWPAKNCELYIEAELGSDGDLGGGGRSLGPGDTEKDPVAELGA